MIRVNDKGEREICLVEIFKSIDGEAFHSGQATVFIRTMGCNLRCSWCDTSYSFTEEEMKKKCNAEPRWMSADEILAKVECLEENFPHKSVCLTGGEPLMDENREFLVEDLVPLLLKRGYAVNIETNGSIDYAYYKKVWGKGQSLDGYGNRQGVTLITDWKLPSSGMSRVMRETNLDVLDEEDVIKFVITDDEKDWKELERICQMKDVRAKKYLSPCWGSVTLEKIPEFVIKHPEYDITAQVQVHKIFWDPDQIGV